MRVIIIGNGLAGVILAKTLRELDDKTVIDIFAQEKYHYYPRPNLIEYLAGKLPREKLFPFSGQWFESRNISVKFEKPVEKLFLQSREVEPRGGEKEKYDILVLANGARPFFPPFKGMDKQGVLSLRTLDDADFLTDRVDKKRKIIIIGGGLLGLEVARALKTRGAEVDIVEYFSYLLPKQLDPRGGEILKDLIEKMGISVHVGMMTKELLGREEISGIRFQEGKEMRTETALVAAGVRPNTGLAKEAGLEVNQGVVIDELCRTSHSKVYAAGDVTQFQGVTYGIIPATYDQAQVAAANIAGQEKKYRGTVPSNTLKVMGIDLTSLGLINPEGDNFEEIKREDRERGIYKKIVLEDGKAAGAIWLGLKKGINEMSRAVKQKKDISQWKKDILEDDFDFSIL